MLRLTSSLRLRGRVTAPRLSRPPAFRTFIPSRVASSASNPAEEKRATPPHTAEDAAAAAERMKSQVAQHLWILHRPPHVEENLENISFWDSKKAQSHEDGPCYEFATGLSRTITMNRPKQMNSLNLDMIRYIYPRLKMYEENNDLVCSMLVGYPFQDTKRPAFCAGGDIVSIYKARGTELTKTFFREEYELNHLISALQKPFIAFMNGITMGGGVGLSVHGKYRVATELTLFAMPETGIGFFPDVGGSYFLPRLDGQLGMYLGLTGARLSGTDCFHAGIATHYIPTWRLSELHQRLDELNPGPEGVEGTLEGFHDGASVAQHPFSLATHLDEIDECFSKDSVEDIFAALEAKRTPFCTQTLHTLRKMSPTSLKVTFAAIRAGARMSMEECLRMEYRICQTFMEGNEFFEGVRALLIDKNPSSVKWNPPVLEGVTKAMVDAYFKPRADDLNLGYLGGKGYRPEWMPDERKYFYNLENFDFFQTRWRSFDRVEPPPSNWEPKHPGYFDVPFWKGERKRLKDLRDLEKEMEEGLAKEKAEAEAKAAEEKAKAEAEAKAAAEKAEAEAKAAAKAEADAKAAAEKAEAEAKAAATPAAGSAPPSS